MNKAYDILDNLENYACWKEEQASKGVTSIGPMAILAGHSEEYVKGFMRGQAKAYMNIVEWIIQHRAELRDQEEEDLKRMLAQEERSA